VVSSLTPTLPEQRAASQVEVAPISSGAGSMPSGETIDKGLKGFK
jgi:hypothetical protein